ncbi:FGGY family carbohydrate kinase [Gilvimarinus sp. SDUM040013]|uniref:FGGY family carbohydrate kinase n=1 Tax=Gilvimarinus gilvus TaxID=3058038 RepID=A0ABU4S1J2_9GAMM|nr:FGGY family carbohydrate kinase [Gilvimarinus sp. SDUM040013]MDO3384420.1 FGGY family carbohydrate kinase [Gilvimarinus sp. SDUM040013]MDX6851025.1 FGGY family carbohydrate kinase [Gilvimarinus sp. SDUM040013]
MLFLGLDIGSSSTKLSVIEGATGRTLAAVSHPEAELAIDSPEAGFAEQDPATWWHCVQEGLKKISAQGVDLKQVEAIGISYQMHGLVLVDAQQQVLRPAIIWCDSRAVPYGEAAFEALGADYCFDRLLNSPGNFTAAKLRWVQENRPEVFAKVHKAMLPGDYIAMKLSGEINTTATGLSEGTFWDYQKRAPAAELLQHWGMDADLLPDIVPTIGEQCQVSDAAAAELGLTAGVKISYRGGDQPNNAFSLNVLEAGEVAATAGTSGVIYGVTDKNVADHQSRVNTFVHVTDTEHNRRNGVLVCVNGTGRLYSWLRQMLATGGEVSYPTLNNLAADVPVGSDGLIFHPFGNGAERIFQNRNMGAHIRNLDFNRHGLGHMVRAAQEGIVFALNQGFDVLKSLGGSCEVIKVAKGNMFLSDVFAQTFANTTQAAVELYDTDGAAGAARGAALGCGFYSSPKEAFAGLQPLGVIEPNAAAAEQYQQAYHAWQKMLPALD